MSAKARGGPRIGRLALASAVAVWAALLVGVPATAGPKVGQDMPTVGYQLPEPVATDAQARGAVEAIKEPSGSGTGPWGERPGHHAGNPA
jgi:hypothetical protein